MRSILVALVLVPAIAHADDGDAQVALRFPFDVYANGRGVQIGMIGIGGDLGGRVSDALYLGVTGDYQLVIDGRTGDDPRGMHGPDVRHRLRAGVEGRWYFAEGLATVTSGGCDCGCAPVESTVMRRAWLGVRGGVETFDRATIGRFADVTLGMDYQLTTNQLGMYVSAGVSREPGDADRYGGAIGLRVVFGS